MHFWLQILQNKVTINNTDYINLFIRIKRWSTYSFQHSSMSSSIISLCKEKMKKSLFIITVYWVFRNLEKLIKSYRGSYLFYARTIDRLGSSSRLLLLLFPLSMLSTMKFSPNLSNPTLLILFADSSITLVYFHCPFCFTISAAITEGSIVKWWLYS